MLGRLTGHEGWSECVLRGIDVFYFSVSCTKLGSNVYRVVCETVSKKIAS